MLKQLVLLGLALLSTNQASWAIDINHDNAEVVLKRIDAQLAKDPNNDYLQVDRGRALGCLERYDEERAQGELLLKRKQSRRDGYMLIEHSYACQRLYREAIEAIDKAFTIEKAKAPELLLKITLLLQNKNYQEALRLCDQVITLIPNNPKVYERRADCYYQIYGPCKKSLDDLEKSAALDPRSERVQDLIKIVKGELAKRSQ